MAKIAELWSYPVKGCAAVPLTETAVAPAGLAHDRSFMVTDEAGGFRSQRGSPDMARIVPVLSQDGERLALSAPGAGGVEWSIVRSGPARAVSLFGVGYRGIDQGDAAAGWLSRVLDAPSRLVRVPADHQRVTDGLTPGTSGFADSGAVLIASRGSWALLRQRITDAAGAPVPMDRFRPNIVVDGWEGAHREDEVRRVTIGAAELGYAKLAIRCAVTTVDQRRGVRAGPEPLRALARYRRAVSGGVAFGAKFSVLRPGTIAVGDSLDVTAWGPSELPSP